MKTKYLKLKTWLFISLGSLLGMAIGCEQPDMYGTPERPYDDTVATKNTPSTQYYTDNYVTQDE